ncbi:MAG: GNAT family N-acetyltransferase [Cyanobacteria bacterium J06639_1]
MQVRVAQSTDIETLFVIHTSVKENHQSRAEIAALGITPDSVVTMLQTDCRAWLVDLDDRPVGFAIANATEQTIFGLFVLPEYEGRGVGKALLSEAENWLRSQGCSDIWLTTGNDPTLRAYGFYLHEGWTLADLVSEDEIKLVKSV